MGNSTDMWFFLNRWDAEMASTRTKFLAERAEWEAERAALISAAEAAASESEAASARAAAALAKVASENAWQTEKTKEEVEEHLLAQWCSLQRRRFRLTLGEEDETSRGRVTTLSEEQIKRLNVIGFPWNLERKRRRKNNSGEPVAHV